MQTTPALKYRAQQQKQRQLRQQHQQQQPQQQLVFCSIINGIVKSKLASPAYIIDRMDQVNLLNPTQAICALWFILS